MWSGQPTGRDTGPPRYHPGRTRRRTDLISDALRPAPLSAGPAFTYWKLPLKMPVPGAKAGG